MGASQSPGGNKVRLSSLVGQLHPGLSPTTLIAQQGGAVDSIRPVTIKQLHGADHPHPDAKFYVDGFELAAVSRPVFHWIGKILKVPLVLVLMIRSEWLEWSGISPKLQPMCLIQ